MDTAVLTTPAAKTVQVWDPLLRICHWTLAAGFAVAFIAEEGDLVHQVAGYIVAAAVAIRLVWGFVGPRHARFSDFVTGPRVLFTHLADMLRFRERRYLGHNPAAMNTGARPDVQQVVGGADGFLVMFNDDDGVAKITQVPQRFEETFVVPLVQADAWLIQDIQNPHKPGTDLGCQANALGFAAA